MIIIVAPYLPPNREGNTNLGAARKLEMVISILARLNLPLLLVNSAHNGSEAAPISIKNLKINNVKVTEITPPFLASSTIGKLKHILSMEKIIAEIVKLGDPHLFWFYNAYAFEMCFAFKARNMSPAPMVLEFEDWHFSRVRGFNPKPYIDYLFWRISAQYMFATFAVNSFLANKMRRYGSHIELLPGVVPFPLVIIAKEFPPFLANRNHINIGYFGGLSLEKGADIVLQLAHQLPAEFTLHVTGTGPLEAELSAFSRIRPGSLCFHGRVDDVALYELIAKCDVILNPHVSIEVMHDGVFPFKVIEAVASGRLLISTAVPTDGLDDLLAGVQFVEHSTKAFIEAISVCRQQYLDHAALIFKCAETACQRFGEIALLERVSAIMKTYGK